MKTIIYNAISIDGFIATPDDEAKFVSEIEWKSFRAKIKECGNLIVGRRTYDLMKEAGEIEKTFMVVLTKKRFKEDGVNCALSPAEAISLVEKHGCKTALLGGGGLANGAFLEAGLVDEIFLDVEPAVLGAGIKLFEGMKVEKKLKLIETKKLSRDEIQLHYKVVKN